MNLPNLRNTTATTRRLSPVLAFEALTKAIAAAEAKQT
jgi:hypothetical protein